MKGTGIAMATLLGVAAPALAQDTDQLQMAADDGPIWNFATDREFLAILQDFGECSARDSRSNSRNVLRDLPGSKQSNQSLFWTLLGSNSCKDNGRTPNVLPAAYRGVVAEYYLERDFELPAFTGKRASASIFTDREAASADAAVGEAAMALPYIAIGRCLAKADPAGMAALFDSSPGSGEESDAFVALERNAAECSRDDARPVSNMFQLRGYLAEGAYRFAVRREAAE